MPAPDIGLVIERLREKHPDAKYELNWSTPLELLVATTLAAQCTDERVNRITESLFKKYTSAQAYLDVPAEELENDIRASGTYKQKAKSIRGACQAIVDRFGGEVPRTMAELTTLPGIARKSANVVLNTAFDIASGIIVDTHVARVGPRMGLTQKTKPEDIERDLMQKVPQSDWTFFGPAMVLHGRYTCVARGPKCDECIFEDVCPKVGVLAPRPKPPPYTRERCHETPPASALVAGCPGRRILEALL